MSQAQAFRALDATLHAAFAGAGLADTGTYTPPAGSPVAVRGYLDEELVQAVGEFAESAGVRTVLTLLREDVPSPVVGAAVVMDGGTFVLEAPVAEDAGASRWVVRRAG